METSEINITKPDRDLFDTSTPPYENYSYGLETALLTDKNQEIYSGGRLLFIDDTVEDYQRQDGYRYYCRFW